MNQIFIIIEESADQEDTQAIYDTVAERIAEKFPDREDIAVVTRPKSKLGIGLIPGVALLGSTHQIRRYEELARSEEIRLATMRDKERELTFKRELLIQLRERQIRQQESDQLEAVSIESKFRKMIEEIKKLELPEAKSKGLKKPKNGGKPFYLKIEGKKKCRW